MRKTCSDNNYVVPRDPLGRNSPPVKKAVLSDTKMSLAKWFCERILRVKPTSTNSPPSPVPTDTQEVICEPNVVPPIIQENINMTGEIPITVKNQFDTFKKELLGKIKSMDECLIQQAENAFLLASSQLEANPNTVNADYIYGSLMHSAPTFWKTEILESLPKQMEKIVQISSSLLNECVNSLGQSTSKDSSTYEEVRLKRLMEFCNLLNQRTANRIHEISQALLEKDADQMVREACAFTLVANGKQTPISLHTQNTNETESLKKLSLEAAYNIKKQFSKTIGGSISLLSDIEKDIYQSANLVMVTLQTPPAPTSLTATSPSPPPPTPTFNHHHESVQLFKKKKSEVEPWAKLSGITLPPNSMLKLNDSPFSEVYNTNSQFSLVSSEPSRKRRRDSYIHANGAVPQSHSSPISHCVTKKIRINEEDEDDEMRDIYSSIPSSIIMNNNSYNNNNNMNNKLINEEKVEIEMLENKFSTISLAPHSSLTSKGLKSSTLSSLCISTIVSNLSKYNEVGSFLPEHLISKILRKLISTRRVTLSSISKLFSSSQTTISSLDLSDCKQLTLSICERLAKYTNQSALKYINLSNCTNITSDCLITLLSSSAKHLEVINLTGCFKIDHKAISFLAKKCTNLKSVTLQGCTNISDSSISELLQYNPSLKELNLRDCAQITDNAFSHSQALSQLRLIDITECQITDKSVISIINTSTSLLSVKLSGKGITDESVTAIAHNCPNLQVLEVSTASITNSSIHVIAKSCPKLHTLKVPFCRQISVDLFRLLPSSSPSSSSSDINMSNSEDEAMQTEMNETEIERLFFPALKRIDISRNSEVTDRTIEDFIISVNTKNIEEINISSCEELSDRCFLKIAKTFGASLKSLNLSKCAKLTDDSFSQIIKCCINLKKLSIYNCPLISDRSLLLLSTHCKQIEELDLSSCEQITDASFKSLAPLHTLTSLSLEEANITDQSLISILQNNCKLETVKLGYCKVISDSTLTYIALYCPSLKVLDLSYCSDISITALRSALSQLPQLTELNLRGFNNLIYDGFEHPNLVSLNLSWCKNIEDAAITRIAKGCSSLVDLDLAWCVKLTKHSLYQLAENCNALRTLNFSGCTPIPFLRQ